MAVAALGQLAAFAVYVASGSGSALTFAKLGWFYFGWFHHVGLVAELPDLALGRGASQSIGGALPGGTSISYTAGLALMLVTLVAGGLLFLAGRAAAGAAGGGPAARMLHGMKIAPAYAVPALLISLAVSIDTAIPANAFVGGRVRVHESTWQSFVFPFAIALIAGALGGSSTVGPAVRRERARVRRTLGSVAGGVRMFLLAIVLAFVGMLVLAAVRPDATKAYLTAVSEPPADQTAVVVAHHILLLPNQSMWVLVPAMGSCDGAYGSGFSAPFLCYWKYPQTVKTSLISPQAGLGDLASPVDARFGTAPWWSFLFLLVPLVSVLAGGWHGARHGGAETAAEGGLLGAAAGVVFAVFVAAGIWLSSVSAGLNASVLGMSTGGSVRVGPDLLSGTILALLWGVVGG
ncbi:MAG TPA: hypothetical protein VE646_02110, partial [Actinomycetota bacterium]|nr:hypothetical protein [Actinomycetota bacterium]